MPAHDIRFGILALAAEGFENSLPLRNAPLPVTRPVDPESPYPVARHNVEPLVKALA